MATSKGSSTPLGPPIRIFAIGKPFDGWRIPNYPKNKLQPSIATAAGAFPLTFTEFYAGVNECNVDKKVNGLLKLEAVKALWRYTVDTHFSHELEEYKMKALMTAFKFRADEETSRKVKKEKKDSRDDDGDSSENESIVALYTGETPQPPGLRSVLPSANQDFASTGSMSVPQAPRSMMQGGNHANPNSRSSNKSRGHGWNTPRNEINQGPQIPLRTPIGSTASSNLPRFGLIISKIKRWSYRLEDHINRWAAEFGPVRIQIGSDLPELERLKLREDYSLHMDFVIICVNSRESQEKAIETFNWKAFRIEPYPRDMELNDRARQARNRLLVNDKEPPTANSKIRRNTNEGPGQDASLEPLSHQRERHGETLHRDRDREVSSEHSRSLGPRQDHAQLRNPNLIHNNPQRMDRDVQPNHPAASGDAHRRPSNYLRANQDPQINRYTQPREIDHVDQDIPRLNRGPEFRGRSHPGNPNLIPNNHQWKGRDPQPSSIEMKERSIGTRTAITTPAKTSLTTPSVVQPSTASPRLYTDSNSSIQPSGPSDIRPSIETNIHPSRSAIIQIPHTQTPGVHQTYPEAAPGIEQSANLSQNVPNQNPRPIQDRPLEHPITGVPNTTQTPDQANTLVPATANSSNGDVEMKDSAAEEVIDKNTQTLIDLDPEPEIEETPSVTASSSKRESRGKKSKQTHRGASFSTDEQDNDDATMTDPPPSSQPRRKKKKAKETENERRSREATASLKSLVSVLEDSSSGEAETAAAATEVASARSKGKRRRGRERTRSTSSSTSATPPPASVSSQPKKKKSRPAKTREKKVGGRVEKEKKSNRWARLAGALRDARTKLSGDELELFEAIIARPA
ncbi:hypothetical protein PVAG01_10912 [Phlyctema vagabunda]|uniref:Uncharacterized protein n=1 Tax=Phlyctema vagabunda TaxID=108571 RepID=A0ABR4P3L1_9HELO